MFFIDKILECRGTGMLKKVFSKVNVVDGFLCVPASLRSVSLILEKLQAKFDLRQSLITLLAILFCNILAGQTNDPIIHLDKSFYVSGEIIWYKVYLPKGMNEGVLQMIIANEKGEALGSNFLRISEQGFAEGHFKIPYDWSSNYYYFNLEAAHQQSTQSSTLASFALPIYNDLDDLPANIEIQEPADNPNSFLEDELDIQLSLDKTQYQPGSPIQLTVKINQKDGSPAESHFSISVRDGKLTNRKDARFSNLVRGNRLEASTTFASSINLQGKLRDLKGNPLQTNYLAAYFPDRRTFHYSKSNDQGEFFISLPDIDGEEEMQFGVYLTDDFQVQLHQAEIIDPKGTLPYSPAILKYLEASRDRKKIYQLFSSLETSIPIENKRSVKKEWKPDRRIIFDRYEPFKNVQTFFHEIITTLKLREREGGDKIIAKVFNPATEIRTYYLGWPLFIINDRLTWNADYIGRLNPRQLDEAHIFHDYPKLMDYFGPIASSGLAVFKTKPDRLNLPDSLDRNVFTIQGFQPKVDFKEVFQPGEEIPTFRSVLYWNSALRTDRRGQRKVNFQASDDISTFEIEVVAQDEEGRMGVKRMSFEVKF